MTLVATLEASLARSHETSTALRVARQVVRHLPLERRLDLRRALLVPRQLRERSDYARTRVSSDGLARFAHRVVALRSPLHRPSAAYGPQLAAGKAQNVRRVAELLDRVALGRGETLSYHQLVGWPSRLRGFALGPEMHGGRLVAGVGGGACQVSNMLYQLGLLAGLEVVERHRHGLDLFPDSGRTMPFGCGATVFYGLADLKLRNVSEVPLVFRFEVVGGELRGELRAPRDPGVLRTIEEREHRFFTEGGRRFRENRVVRETWSSAGALLASEEVAHNLARVCYPCDESEEGEEVRLGTSTHDP